jgi:hypothetical protein
MISIGREIQAFRVDEAFRGVLRGGLVDITHEVPGLYHHVIPEIDFLIDSVYYLFSIMSNKVPSDLI